MQREGIITGYLESGSDSLRMWESPLRIVIPSPPFFCIAEKRIARALSLSGGSANDKRANVASVVRLRQWFVRRSLHSSTVKLTMIRRRSRALTHCTFLPLLSPLSQLLSRPSLSSGLLSVLARRCSSFFYRLVLPRTGRKSLSLSRPRLSTPLNAPRVETLASQGER